MTFFQGIMIGILIGLFVETTLGVFVMAILSVDKCSVCGLRQGIDPDED